MRTLLLAAVGAVAFAGTANAAAVITFDEGLATPSLNYTVIDTFDDLSGVTVNSGTVLIKNPPSDGQGAPPANSVPAGTSYLSVLGGGSATINFAPGVRAFQFDWGSIDSYNTLTVTSTAGVSVFVPGSMSFPNDANGNQSAPGTNGRFTVRGSTAGETFVSMTLASSSNSFEIDNLATGVIPEPATWAMLITGFGLVGAAMRRQRQTTARVSA
jgi:hypothetical protein